jgi:hypothetical protein
VIVRDPAHYLIHLEAVIAMSQDEAERKYAALQSGTSFEEMARELAASGNPAPAQGGRGRDPYYCPGGSAQCSFELPVPDRQGDIGLGWPDRSSRTPEGVWVAETATLGFGRFLTWPKEVTDAVRDVPVGQIAKPIALGDKWVILRVIERRPPSFEEVSTSLIARVSDNTEMGLERDLLKAARIELVPPRAPDYVFATINGEPITAFDYLDYTNRDFDDLYVDQEIPDKLKREREGQFGHFYVGRSITLNDLGYHMELFRPFLLTQIMTQDHLWDDPRLQDELALWRMVLLAVDLRDVLSQEIVDSGQFRTVDYHGTLAQIVSAETAERARELAEALRSGTPLERLPNAFEGCAVYASRASPSGEGGGEDRNPRDCDGTTGLAVWYDEVEDAPIMRAAKNAAIGDITSPVKVKGGWAVALILDRLTVREGAPTDAAALAKIESDAKRGIESRDDSPWRLIRDAVNSKVHDVMLPRLKAEAKIEMATP